jgi:hypothetical protein
MLEHGCASCGRQKEDKHCFTCEPCVIRRGWAQNATLTAEVERLKGLLRKAEKGEMMTANHEKCVDNWLKVCEERDTLTAEVDNLRHQRDVAVLKADRRQRNETSLRTRVAELEGALRSLAEAADCVGGLDEWDSDERLRLETVEAFESLARAALDEGGK